MKFSMTGQENGAFITGDCLIEVTAWTDLTVHFQNMDVAYSTLMLQISINNIPRSRFDPPLTFAIIASSSLSKSSGVLKLSKKKQKKNKCNRKMAGLNSPSIDDKLGSSQPQISSNSHLGKFK